MSRTGAIWIRTLAIGVVAAMSSPAKAVVIDSFTTNQAAVGDPPGGATVVTGGADIIGTRRSLSAITLMGVGPTSGAVAGGSLTVAVTATTPDSRGEVRLAWDGNVDPSTLDPAGLGGADLTTGNHTGLRIRVAGTTVAGSELVVIVHTSANDRSRAARRLPLIAGSTDVFLPFSAFRPIGGTGADFTDVGAIELIVRATESTVTIDEIETAGATLAATKVDLTTSSDPIGGTPQTPGTTVRYRVTITNTGSEAVSSAVTDTLDTNLALVANSIDATPVAVEDQYGTPGNVNFSVVAAQGLLVNDIDPDGGAVTVTTVGAIATALGGTATVAADGSFDYAPPAGIGTAVDTFSYSIVDNEANAGSATATIHIGERIWFVDNAHCAAPCGTGTFADPFGSLAQAQSASFARDTIFLFTGNANYPDGFVLKNRQRLIGQGIGLIVDGVTLVAAGTAPTIINQAGAGVTLAQNNTASGFTVGNTTGAGIAGANFGTFTAAGIAVNGTGNILDLDQGTLAATFGALASTSGSVRAIELTMVGGTLSATSTSVAGGSQQAIFVGQAPGSAAFTFGPTTVNGAAGVSLTNSAAMTTNFSSLAITATAGSGLVAASAGTLAIDGSSNTIAATGGPAVDITSTSLGASATFSTVSSTTSTGKGINLDTVTGSFTANGGSISGAVGVAFDLNAGAANVTYAGSISNAAGRSVEITGRTGGTVTLSGNINDTAPGTGINVASNTGGTINLSGSSKTLNTGANPAVTLATNTGATINFTGGGLDIDTTSGTGFNATGGATGISVQGSGNSITSTTGTALNIASSTIAPAGLTFQSISANGAANGIVLSSSGSSGGLTVTGNGSPGSGGTIQNISGRGASFVNAASISLARMNLTNTATSAGTPCGSAAVVGANTGCNAAIHLDTVTGASFDNLTISTSGQQGINAINVTGFTLSNSTLSGLGNGPDEDGIHGHNVLGSVAITSTMITGSGDDNVNIQNRSAAPSTIAITGGAFNTGVLGSGLLFGIRDSSNTAITITNVTTDNNFSGGIVADAFDTASMTLDVTGSTITNNNDGVQVSSSQTSTAQFDINNNSFVGNDFLAITLLKAAFSSGGALEGAVRNNSPIAIANGRPTDAISVFQAGGGALRVAITNNVINYAGTQRAILIQAGQDGNGSLDATVTGNSIDVQLDGVGNAVAGILAQAALTGPGTLASACGDLGGAGALRNTFTHSLGGSMAGGDIRVRQRNDGTFRLPGYGGAPTDTAAVATYLSGRNTLVSAPTATFESTGFGGGAACTQPNYP